MTTPARRKAGWIGVFALLPIVVATRTQQISHVAGIPETVLLIAVFAIELALLVWVIRLAAR